jgi:Cys-tRNA(Pro)/Cys-tRNA(Cys) deacylase
MVYPTVIEMLEQNGAAFHIHEHLPVTTIHEANEKVPHLTRNLIKTVVFRIKNADWVLAAVKGSDRIHYKKLAAAVAVKRTDLRSIAPEEVESGLGFEVGGVGPFPVRKDIRVVFDDTLGDLGTVFCGSGKNTRTVEIKIADLIGLSGGLVYPICR